MLKPYGYGYDPMFEESTETKCHQLPVVAGALLSLMALQHYAEQVRKHGILMKKFTHATFSFEP